MKKFLSLLLATGLCFLGVFGFSGCKKKSSAIRLNEVTHSIFYAPLYVAINLGYFEDENITIELTNGGGSDVSMTALLAGSADIALLGTETVVYVAAQGSTNHPKVFGQLTKRDGSFLISRTNETDFSWLSLEGKEVITGRKGGMPAMTFEYVVNNIGLYDGVNIDLNTDVSFNAIAPTFYGGAGDYCTLFEPLASDFEAEGKGYVIASVGEFSGEVPFTCFMAMPNFINKNKDKIEGFLRAIKRAYNFIMTSDDEAVANALAPSFEGSERSSILKAVDSYRRIDAWMATPAMTESSFRKLLAILRNSDELTGEVDFSAIVDNSFAFAIE